MHLLFRGSIGPDRKAALRKTQRRLAFERLTDRLLLSSAAPTFEPGVQLSAAVGTALPQGFTPQQISQAYGFNQVRFADGSVTATARADDRHCRRVQRSAYRRRRRTSTSNSTCRRPDFQRVNENGGTSLPAANAGGGWRSLDVEWAHAIAPEANIMLFEASKSTGDMLQAVNMAGGSRASRLFR